MKNIWLASVLGLALLTSCKSKQAASTAKVEEEVVQKETKSSVSSIQMDVRPDLNSLQEMETSAILLDSMSFERTACYGRCPVFEVVFYNDGTLKYNGKAFVDSIGNYTASVPRSLLSELEGLLYEINFMSLDDSYDNQQITDLPSATYEYWSAAKHKKVYARVGVPKELANLAQHLDYMISRAENWVKQERN